MKIYLIKDRDGYGIAKSLSPEELLNAIDVFALEAEEVKCRSGYTDKKESTVPETWWIIKPASGEPQFTTDFSLVQEVIENMGGKAFQINENFLIPVVIEDKGWLVIDGRGKTLGNTGGFWEISSGHQHALTFPTYEKAEAFRQLLMEVHSGSFRVIKKV